MQNNPDALCHVKRNSKHSKVYNKQERKLVIHDTMNPNNMTVERSLSMNNLKNTSLSESHRSLSASNLYALTDPNLSLKQAVSKKPYDKPNTSFAKEKAMFTAWTQKYFHQVTVGCGNKNCLNRFCKSSVHAKRFNQSMAALLSIELSCYKDQYLCIRDEKKQQAAVLDDNIFKTNSLLDSSTTDNVNIAMPFLYKFYSTSPFRSLFLPCPLTSSGLGLYKTHSHNELPTSNNYSVSSVTKRLQNHLKVITSTISSSLNNLWKASNATEEQKPSMSVESMNTEFKDSDEQEKHKTFLTRKRLPSIRIFGENHAVDTDCNTFENIDEFETGVAEEFRQDATDDEADCDKNVDAEVVDDGEENIDGYSLTHLTLDMFDSVVTNYYECKDESFLINTLRTVFSSWDALSLSFSEEGLKKKNDFPFNINCSDVEKMFQTLVIMENSDKFVATLIDTVQVLLLSKKDRITKPSELKPLIIILKIPFLFEHYPMVQQLTAVISHLSTVCRGVLICYLSDLKKEKFTHLLKGFKSLISNETSWAVPSLKNNTSLVNLCKTLSVIYKANILKGDYNTIVDPSHFYCHGLTKKIDFKQEYAFWKKQRQGMGESILDYPFLLEPTVKVQVMHVDAITQMREEYQDAIVHQARVQQVQKSWSDFDDASPLSNEVRSAMCPYLLLEIRRENFIQDTIKQLHEKSSDFKKPLKIKYTSGGEQGLDMGGLQKEFFQVVVESMFDPDFSMFTLSEDGHQVWFNAFSFESNVMFEFIGILLGLAIYNGIILDIHFPLLVYKKLLGFPVVLDDLKEMQPTLCSGLEQLLQYDGDVENDLLLTFQVSHNIFGRTIKTDLVANGSDVMVTNDNRKHFVDLYVDTILNKSIEKQFEAFKRGFYQVCHGPTIQLFTPPELELLICGSPDLDFKALESVTEYKDGFTKTHALMLEFWQIVHEFTFKQKQALLMFVTGSYRVPLKGLGSMSFYIQRNGPDSNNLPTSMTCFNRLLLSEYNTGAKLKRMLLLAIENSKGFGLT